VSCANIPSIWFFNILVVQVARLAGLPASVIQSAYRILHERGVGYSHHSSSLSSTMLQPSAATLSAPITISSKTASNPPLLVHEQVDPNESTAAGRANARVNFDKRQRETARLNRIEEYLSTIHEDNITGREALVAIFRLKDLTKSE
jgi:DNA mismatch repair ATPase MutS